MRQGSLLDINSGFGSESLLGIKHGLDTIVHILDEGDFTESETALVGDVENTAAGVGVFSMDSADLHVVFVGDRVEFSLVLGLAKVLKADVHGGAKGSSEVGGARSDVTEMVVVGKAGHLLNVSSGSAETLEHFANASTLLHGDDTELVLFVDPDEESLGIVVENTTVLGPVAVEAASFQEAVTLLEEEMVLNQLISIFF